MKEEVSCNKGKCVRTARSPWDFLTEELPTDNIAKKIEKDILRQMMT